MLAAGWQGPRAWIDDQPGGISAAMFGMHVQRSARSPPSNVMMMEPAWDCLSVQWARRASSGWSMLARLRYRSRFRMWLARYCLTSTICPNGSMNCIVSSPSSVGSKKSVDGGVIRSLRGLHRRHEPRQRMAKGRQALAWSEGKSGGAGASQAWFSRPRVMIRPSLLRPWTGVWQVGSRQADSPWPHGGKGM